MHVRSISVEQIASFKILKCTKRYRCIQSPQYQWVKSTAYMYPNNLVNIREYSVVVSLLNKSFWKILQKDWIKPCNMGRHLNHDAFYFIELIIGKCKIYWFNKNEINSHGNKEKYLTSILKKNMGPVISYILNKIMRKIGKRTTVRTSFCFGYTTPI